MHLNLIDNILRLIIFCYSGFNATQRCSAFLEQKSIGKDGFKNLL